MQARMLHVTVEAVQAASRKQTRNLGLQLLAGPRVAGEAEEEVVDAVAVPDSDEMMNLPPCLYRALLACQ